MLLLQRARDGRGPKVVEGDPHVEDADSGQEPAEEERAPARAG